MFREICTDSCSEYRETNVPKVREGGKCPLSGDILYEKVNRTLVLSFKNEPLYLEEKNKIFSRYGGFSLDYYKR